MSLHREAQCSMSERKRDEDGAWTHWVRTVGREHRLGCPAGWSSRRPDHLQLTTSFKGLHKQGRGGRLGGWRGRALAPRSGGIPLREVHCTPGGAVSSPPAAALCSLPRPAPPRENSLFWGIHPRRPEPPAGPGERSPRSFGPHQPWVLNSQTSQPETGSCPVFPDWVSPSLSRKHRWPLLVDLNP